MGLGGERERTRAGAERARCARRGARRVVGIASLACALLGGLGLPARTRGDDDAPPPPTTPPPAPPPAPRPPPLAPPGVEPRLPPAEPPAPEPGAEPTPKPAPKPAPKPPAPAPAPTPASAPPAGSDVPAPPPAPRPPPLHAPGAEPAVPPPTPAPSPGPAPAPAPAPAPPTKPPPSKPPAPKPTQPKPTPPATTPRPPAPPAAAPARPAPAPAPAPAEPEAPASFSARGSAQVRYVGRASEGRSDNTADQDHDVYADLMTEVGYGEHVRAQVSARLGQDLNGRGSTVFDSIDDTWDTSFHGYVYEAWLEARALGPVATVRAGRQWKGDGVEVRFDGALVESAWLADAVKLEAWVGKPVRLYESTARGDWLAGAAIEARPLDRLDLRLDYVHVTDRRRSVGVRPLPARRQYRDDDLVQLTARYRLTDTVRLFARAATFAGRSSRFEAEAYHHDPASDLLVRARYLVQLGSYRDLSIEYSPLDEVIDRYEPYHEVLGELKKGFAETVWVGGGAAARILGSGAREGPYNHEFTRLFGSIEVVDQPWRGLSAFVLFEHYQADEGPDRRFVVSGDLTQEVVPGLRVSVGSAYELFKFDDVFLEERNDVRSVYARLDWEPVRGLRVRAGYALEIDDEDTYHTFRVGVRYAW